MNHEPPFLPRSDRIVAIHAGRVRSVAASGGREWWDKEWETGFFKEPVAGEVFVGLEAIEGDAQADRVNHGGPDKAVCVYAAAHYPDWRQSLNLPEMPFGAFGENFTVEGLVEDEVCIGDVFEAEGVVFQISQPRQPCWKLSRRWKVKDLSARVVANGRTGWYFRVLQTGRVSAGTMLRLRERPHPNWTVTAANGVMHLRQGGDEAAAGLAACAALSGSWRESLERRAASVEE